MAENQEGQIEVLDPQGRAGNIPVEQIDDALGQGYKLSKHIIMYDRSGRRGLIPKEQGADAMKAGYQVQPETQFEKERKGLTGDQQEADYRRAYENEGKRARLVLTDSDVATAGLGGIGIGKSIANQGIKVAAKGVAKSALGAAGGSFAGSHGGRALGSIVGHPDEGAQIGATVGGLAGGLFSGLHGEPVPEKGPYVPASESPSVYRGPSSLPKPVVEPTVVPVTQSPGPYKGPSSVTPPLGNPENPGLHSKMPTRMPKPQVTSLSDSPNAPLYELNAADKKAVPLSQSPNANRKPSPFSGASSTAPESVGAPIGLPAPREQAPFPMVQSASPEAESVGAKIYPEPRDPLPGDRPGAMWSVGRKEVLPAAAQRGTPGAVDVMRNTGQPILLTPREGVGYSRPGEFEASQGRMQAPLGTPMPPAAEPAGLKPGLMSDIPQQAINPQELEEASRQAGRPISEAEFPEWRRQIEAERNIEQGLQGNRKDTAGEIREKHRAKLEKKGTR